MMKVSLYGPYPPNIGGVSIHIQRLASKLQKKEELSVIYVNNYKFSGNIGDSPFLVDLSDYSRFNLFKRIKFVKQMMKEEVSIYHLHGSIFWDYFYIFCLIVLGRKKVLFTLHDSMQLSRKKIILLILKFFYSLIPKSKLLFVAVNAQIAKQLISIGIDSSLINIIPAFIKEENEAELDWELQKELVDDSVKILIYAPSLNTKENIDIYGINDAMSAIATLININKYSKIKLLLCVPTKIDENLFNQFCNCFDIPDGSFFFYNKPVNNMSKLLKLSDIYLRPTTTDGDSLLVREALVNNCIVLASNVIKRPESTILYKKGSKDDLISKLVELIENIDIYKHKLLKEDDFFDEIYKQYINLLHK